MNTEPEKSPAAEPEKKRSAGPAVTHGQLLWITRKKADGNSGGSEAAESSALPAGSKAKQTDAPEIKVVKEADGSLGFDWVVRDPSGIHARPAGQIAQIVKNHGAEVTLEAEGGTAAGRSPVQMMGLSVKGGTKLHVKISGDPQETEAAAAELSAFMRESL